MIQVAHEYYFGYICIKNYFLIVVLAFCFVSLITRRKNVLLALYNISVAHRKYICQIQNIYLSTVAVGGIVWVVEIWFPRKDVPL